MLVLNLIQDTGSPLAFGGEAVLVYPVRKWASFLAICKTAQPVDIRVNCQPVYW